MSETTTLERKERELIDAGVDPKTISSPTGKMLLKGLDRVMRMQGGLIEKYVARLKNKNPDATTAELQEKIDSHFLTIVSTTGAGSGGSAAIPGIGFVTGAAAVGAESLLFIDAAAWYTLASAALHGADIKDPQQREALVLLGLLGSKGTAIVDTLLIDADGTIADTANALETKNTAGLLSRFSGPALNEVNTRLVKALINRFGKSVRMAWLGKLLPLGIGAVAGLVANRKLAKTVIKHTQEALNPAH